jgi:CubicO group peptidase (beta-lactamase class C family)
MTVEIAKDGVALYAQAYGYADLASCQLARLDTPYNIGSVTKQFTAAAILQLQTSGLLDLDDPVLKYLPGYEFDPRLTLRMLLNQTSGFVDYNTLTVSNVSEPDILSAITQAPRQFATGSAWQYSNSNYFVLGAVIEVVSSMPYSQYLANFVFAPAGLTHTSYQQPVGAARPYSYTHRVGAADSTGLAVGVVLEPVIPFAAGQLWSTVQDLVLWDAKLRDGAVLSQAAFTEMTTPPPSLPVYGATGSTSTYAMGWIAAVPQAPERPYVWHNGRDLAYTAFNAVTPENGFSVAILTNVDIQESGLPLFPFAQQLRNAVCKNTPDVC